jgi:class 3 adenylate cyclase
LSQEVIDSVNWLTGPRAYDSTPSSYFVITPPSANISYAADPDTFKRTRELEETIMQLRRRMDDLQAELIATRNDAKKSAQAHASIQSTVEELSKKQKLGFLLPKVNATAQKLLLVKPDAFDRRLLEENDSDVFVMSIDIRRSTELMAKARTPGQFAVFMTELCTELARVIIDNYGIVDKFTGDGVLAFFPDFYAGGDDAGIRAVSAADLCHKIFQEKYKAYRTSFLSVLTGVGLGIGIDHGVAHLVQMVGNLTVVGIPVVYACRMSGAEAGMTLLNQPAYEKLNEKFSPYCFFRETEITIKNEGPTLAYEVRLSGKKYQPKEPSWVEDLQSEPEVSAKPVSKDARG